MAIFNEMSIYYSTFMLLIFSDWNSDEESAYFMGWAFAFNSILCLLVNLVPHFRKLLRQLYLYCVKVYKKCSQPQVKP